MSREPLERQDKIGIEISEEMLKRLEALPSAKSGTRRYEFSPAQDAVILKYWQSKRKVDVCQIVAELDPNPLRTSLHENTVRKRYEELTKE